MKNKFRNRQMFIKQEALEEVKSHFEKIDEFRIFNDIGRTFEKNTGKTVVVVQGKSVNEDSTLLMRLDASQLVSAEIPVIAIDGGDGIGKHTQILKLYDIFKNPIKKDYPNYELNSGKVVYDYLHGEVEKTGNIIDDSFRAACLYSINRFEDIYMHSHEWSDERYAAMICDRYTTANIIHMSAFLMEAGISNLDILKQVMKIIQFEQDLGLKQPDLVIRLYSKGDLGKENMKSRESLDDHEKNDNHRKFVNIVGKWLDTVFCDSWISVPVDDYDEETKSYKMKSEDEIHETIKDIVKDIYPDFIK